ncbi:twin-arginine translocase subunit TatC [uncultured Jatrophihabitans sp.]|uniref:twin-arginine translocase subunit TatC n=1 Tax=uncultured Jatrophihabitans sp. TaxID=1610747 RepID=UPI0035CAC4E9
MSGESLTGRRGALRRRSRKRPAKTPDGRMPVMDHLRELRRRIVLILLFVALGAVLGYFLYPHTLDLLRHPYCGVPEKYRYTPRGTKNCVLIYHGVLDGFTTRLKVSVISGAVFTGPLWLYQIWAFITPGLRKNERRYTIFFIVASTLLFAAGVVLAYLVLDRGLPIVLAQAGYGTQAQLTVSDYIGFVTLLLVVFGSAFELPLIVVLANFAGVLPAWVLKKSQRIAIFLIFLFAAVATPTVDPFTMCAMAFPMVLLFEAAVLTAVVHDRRKAARRAAERQEPHLEDHVPTPIDPIPQPLAAREQRAEADSAWSDST